MLVIWYSFTITNSLQGPGDAPREVGIGAYGLWWGLAAGLGRTRRPSSPLSLTTVHASKSGQHSFILQHAICTPLPQLLCPLSETHLGAVYALSWRCGRAGRRLDCRKGPETFVSIGDYR